MNQEANASTPTNQEGAVLSLMNQEANVSTPTNLEGTLFSQMNPGSKCIYSDKPGSKMHLLRHTMKELYLVR